MNFTLTPGVYAALNQLSTACRRKVLEAAQAYVIAGVEPQKLPKNLTVIFMLVVDSATDGQMSYAPQSMDVEQTESEQQPEVVAVDEAEAEPHKEEPAPHDAIPARHTFKTIAGKKVRVSHLRRGRAGAPVRQF